RPFPRAPTASSQRDGSAGITHSGAIPFGLDDLAMVVFLRLEGVFAFLFAGDGAGHRWRGTALTAIVVESGLRQIISELDAASVGRRAEGKHAAEVFDVVVSAVAIFESRLLLLIHGVALGRSVAERAGPRHGERCRRQSREQQCRCRSHDFTWSCLSSITESHGRLAPCSQLPAQSISTTLRWWYSAAALWRFCFSAAAPAIVGAVMHCAPLVRSPIPSR